MRSSWRRVGTASLLLTGLLSVVAAAQVNFDGQASLTGAVFRNRQRWHGWSSLRYLPGLIFEHTFTEQFKAGADFTICCQARFDCPTPESILLNATARPYRASLWVAGQRFETRAGLQKLNFGSAALLRPLQWFDRLDPADPLGFTDGVWGLLCRVWPYGNTALWAWGLLDSSGSGVRNLPDLRTPRLQFGGRAELPLPYGEAAVTFHHVPRCSSGRQQTLPAAPTGENRIGLDAKFDLEIGVWTEAVFAFRSKPSALPGWNSAAAVGADYTLGIGNGLAVLVEHLMRVEPSGWSHATAGMVSYPLSLLDNVRAIVLADWHNHRHQSWLSWQRTLDNWLFAIAGGGSCITGDIGVQLTVALNH